MRLRSKGQSTNPVGGLIEPTDLSSNRTKQCSKRIVYGMNEKEDLRMYLFSPLRLSKENIGPLRDKRKQGNSTDRTKIEVDVIRTHFRKAQRQHN